MSLENLYDCMADMETKKRSDPKAVTVLLNQILESDIKLIDVEHAKAERFLRELVSLPITMFMTQLKNDFDRMKRVARDILKKWADQRRRQLLDMETMKKTIYLKKMNETKLSDANDG